MELQYRGKRSENEIYDGIEVNSAALVSLPLSGNALIYGDNLLALKYLIECRAMAGSVDLVYIDPPFSTNTDFTFSDERSNAVSRANDGEIAYTDKLKGAEFLEFLRERLVVVKKLLSPRGSIYLHIDYKIGHYVKIIMDEVFGIGCFRNDITRIKCNPKNFHRQAYGNVKDMILFYGVGKDFIWNDIRDGYSAEEVCKRFPKIDPTGRRYTTVPLHAPGETRSGPTGEQFFGRKPPPGRHWRTNVSTLEVWNEEGLIEWSKSGNPRKKIFFDEMKGKKVQDIWDFKDTHRQVYPTEKSERLLDRIINSSSLPGSIVLDFFAGSGTTLVAAEKSGRKWIGVDQSNEAIRVAKEKLSKNIRQDNQETLFEFIDIVTNP